MLPKYPPPNGGWVECSSYICFVFCSWQVDYSKTKLTVAPFWEIGAAVADADSLAPWCYIVHQHDLHYASRLPGSLWFTSAIAQCRILVLLSCRFWPAMPFINTASSFGTPYGILCLALFITTSCQQCWHWSTSSEIALALAWFYWCVGLYVILFVDTFAVSLWR